MRNVNRQALEAAENMGIALSEKVLSQIEEYIELLIKWGKTINLTSITEPFEIFRYHFLESFYCGNFIKESGTLADVGSGAGFPGLAIKLLKPELTTWLIEPREKKAFFLKEIIRILSLKNVEVIQKKIENVGLDDTNSVDYITSRAMGRLEAIARWAQKALSPKGKILLLTNEKGIESLHKSGFVLRESHSLLTRREGVIAICQPIRNVSRETFSL